MKDKKRRVIAVSGTPGTGKTTVSKILARKYKLKYLDVKSMIKKYDLSEEFDKERDCEVIDVKKLVLFLIGKISEFKELKKTKFQGMIIDSHLSHNIAPHMVDLCIITKCSLPVLKKRLEKRGYSETKVRENLDAEIFDTCKVEAMEKGHKIKVLWTDKEEHESLRDIISD
ncbi:AAA family ATPase [Candidatus Woesearchaeota archaeon]|nr:AAA family ATPase [Candidatus Woesearchaeota archaeon]